MAVRKVTKISAREAAEAAWKKPEAGISRKGIFRVTRFPKVVVVMPQVKHWKEIRDADLLRVVVFPKEEHVDAFREAKTGVRIGRPAAANPGAIGSIGFNRISVFKYAQPERRYIRIHFAQAHFKTTQGETPGNVMKTPVLPRSLATYYGGWRKRAFGEIIKVAKRNNVSIFIPDHVLQRNGMKNSPVEQEICQLAEEHGLRIVKESLSGLGLSLVPVRQRRAK